MILVHEHTKQSQDQFQRQPVIKLTLPKFAEVQTE